VAVESDLLSRVRAVAALLDDTALAALSNKGLVRRARKDVEQRPPEVVGEHEGRVRVAVEEWTVDVAERPAGSHCSCPANGLCRHILVALIHLGTAFSPHAEATRTPCGAEILAVGDEELRRWAGSALVKRALAESGGAPRTREEVRLSVGHALDEMVAMGLCRLSSASQARLKTLATSAPISSASP